MMSTQGFEAIARRFTRVIGTLIGKVKALQAWAAGSSSPAHALVVGASPACVWTKRLPFSIGADIVRADGSRERVRIEEIESEQGSMKAVVDDAPRWTPLQLSPSDVAPKDTTSAQ